MRKLFANLVCALIPSRQARNKTRKEIMGNAPLTKQIFNAKISESTDTMCRKMSLIQNADVWTLPSGVKVYLPMYPWDYIQRVIANENSFFELDVLDGLQKYIPQNAVILDIGANIGNHSLFWVTSGVAKKIHAFEPVPETFRMLKKNVEINNLENVIIPHNVGLGDKKSEGKIAVQYADNIGGTSIAETEQSSTFSLKIERLDDMNLGESKIDFCKIDVEGFELKTLEGMRKTVKKYKPIVFIETFEKGNGYAMPKGFESNAPQVKKFFAELDYQEGIFFPPFNWLFIPKK